MLDDKDIEKLSEVFATKKDLKETFVTKEEFEGFMEIAATKEELNKVTVKLETMDKKLDEIIELKHEVEYIKNTLNIPALKK